jgi:hypothetical protein
MQKATLVLLTTLLLCSCQAPSQEIDPLEASALETEIYLTGDTLTIEGNGGFSERENMAEIQLSNTANETVALIGANDDYSKAYLAFTENGMDLELPHYELDTFITAEVNNAEWFRAKVYFLDQKNIYVLNQSGHEGSANILAFYNGTEWKELDLMRAIDQSLPEEEKDFFRLLDLAISDPANALQAKVAIGEGYGNTVNYTVFLDRTTLSLLEIQENLKTTLTQ